MGKKLATDLAAENEILRKALALLTSKEKPARSSAAQKPKWDPKWKKTKKLCPHCDTEKLVDPDFGVRVVRGVERPQPWCRECRNTTSYYNSPRKNRSVHNP